MNILYKSVFASFFICLSLSCLKAQDPVAVQKGKNVRIETTDGNQFTGKIINTKNDSLTIETKTAGLVTLPIYNIKKMDYLTPDQLKAGANQFENPAGTHYIIAPNAIGLRKGEGYYQNTDVVVQSLAYGLNDNFSISAGTEIYSLFTGNLPQVYYVATKLSTPVADRFYLGISGSVLLVQPFNGGGTVGNIFGVGTYGNRNDNLSLGLGYRFASSGASDDGVYFTMGGQRRIGKHFSIVGELGLFGQKENFYNGQGGFITHTYYTGNLGLAIRYMAENFALDLGMISAVFTTNSGYAVPHLNVMIPFGKK